MTEGNRFRGRSLPTPVIPTSTICYVIEIPDALEYRAAFFGQLADLGNWWAWEHPTDGTECIDCEEAAQLWRTAVYEGYFMPKNGCGCGGGSPTITDRLNTRIYNDNTITIYESVQNTWNTGGQTVESIAPNLDWETGDPINISKLTCAAIRALLASIAGQGKAINQMTANQSKDLVNGISSALGGLSTASGAAGVLAAAGVGVFGFFASPWLTLGLALGAVGVRIGSLFIAAPPTLFDNAEALENVACAMISNTNDDSITRAKFQGALSPNDFAPGSPEAQLAAMVQPYLDDLTVYLQFMSLGNQLYSVVDDFAALPECGCDGVCGDVTENPLPWRPWGEGAAVWYEGEGFGRGTDQLGRAYIRADIDVVGKTILVSFNEPTSGFIWMFNGDLSQQPIGERYTFSNAYEVVVGPLTVTPGVTVNIGRSVDDINLPLPETMRVKSLCVQEP